MTKDVLAVLEQQGAPAKAITAVKAFMVTAETIRTSELAPAREGRELDALRGDTLRALRDAEAEAIAAVDAEEAAALDAQEVERATRAREHRQLGDIVDVITLRMSDDPVELLALVDTAMHAGDAVGAEARGIAIKRLRELAAIEHRRHVLPTGSTAFAALARLTAQTSNRRADHAGRFEAKRRRVRELVLEVARTVGLAAGLKRAAGTAARIPVPATSRPTMVVGAFWDAHPEFQKQ